MFNTEIKPICDWLGLESKAVAVLDNVARDLDAANSHDASVLAEWDGNKDMKPIQAKRIREIRDVFDGARAESIELMGETPLHSKEYLADRCSIEPDAFNVDGEHKAVKAYRQFSCSNYRVAEFMCDELAKRGITVHDSRFDTLENLDNAEKVAVGCVETLFSSGKKAYGVVYSRLLEATRKRKEWPVAPGVYDVDTGWFLNSSATRLYKGTNYDVTTYNPGVFFGKSELPSERTYILDGRPVVVNGFKSQCEFEEKHPDALGTEKSFGREPRRSVRGTVAYK